MIKAATKAKVFVAVFPYRVQTSEYTDLEWSAVLLLFCDIDIHSHRKSSHIAIEYIVVIRIIYSIFIKLITII